MRELAALVSAGRYVELESDARKLLNRHPDSGFAWKALGIALCMQNKDALHALTRAAALLPDDAEAHCNLANALQSLRRLDDAVIGYRRVLALNPSHAAACNNLGNALRGLGLPDAAVTSYRRALELQPDFVEAHSNLGNALRNLGQLDQAVASYRRALEIKPDYAEACNNLGNALLDLGQLDQAQASYARAAQIKPDFAEAHSNLGNALRALGRLDQAVASYRHAVALHPDFAGAHSNLGDALRDLGQPDAAAASCRRAIELNPDLAGPHNSLGNALLDLGRLDEAVASYRRALVLDRSFVEACVNLGMVLRQLGRAAEAEASCRRALELNPGAAQAIVVLAELRADGGHFAEAEELFKRAVTLNPELSEGWAGIVHLRKMTSDDAPWAAQAQRIAERGLPPRQETYLRFALGKYFDDVKEFEQAFVNYRRANRLLKMHGAKHDRRQLTSAVDLIIHSPHDWTRVSRTRSSASASARPVFIVGMPRSGTSLAEQILASHPAVFGAGELTFWRIASAKMPDSAALAGETSGNILGELADDYLRLLEHLSPDALRVVDKMPANFLSLGLIHAALPNARIIHMRRNPIDTCLSIYFQHFRTAHSYANDLEDLAHYYQEYLRVMRHWGALLPASALLEVPYEGLVDDQDAWSRKMVEFIGLPWDPRCIDFHRTDRRVSTASKWQVRQTISKSSVDRWRNYEKFAGPLLTLVES
jgi:tetratricopeptide (TPR) repeat protein